LLEEVHTLMKTRKTAGSKNKKMKGVERTAASASGGRARDLQKLLLAKREALLDEIKKELGVQRGRPFEGNVGLDLAEEAEATLEEEMSFAAVNRRAEMLQEIDRALERLKEGTYGICDSCGEEISIGRLQALPSALYCTPCQEKQEASSEMLVLRGTDREAA